LVGGTQMQASPQQLPLLAMSSPHCLEEIAATAQLGGCNIKLVGVLRFQ